MSAIVGHQAKCKTLAQPLFGSTLVYSRLYRFANSVQDALHTDTSRDRRIKSRDRVKDPDEAAAQILMDEILAGDIEMAEFERQLDINDEDLNLSEPEDHDNDNNVEQEDVEEAEGEDAEEEGGDEEEGAEEEAEEEDKVEADDDLLVQTEEDKAKVIADESSKVVVQSAAAGILLGNWSEKGLPNLRRS